MLSAAVVGASCGAPLLRLPSGPGTPAPDARAALDQATAPCRNITSITSETALAGSVGGRRLRARLMVGVAAPASARLEAVAAFGPIFVLVAQGNDATLLLPHDNRVLEHGSPSAILEAIAGIPLDAAELRITIIGCAVGGDWRSARRLGNDWIVMPDGPTDLYLRRDSHDALWRLVAAVHHGAAGGEWRAEYQDFRDGLPRAIRLASADSRRFDLRLALSQVEVNVPLDAGVFRVRIPESAVPMSLSELRESGPLADTSSHGR